MSTYRIWAVALLFVSSGPIAEAQKQDDPFGHAPPNIVIVERVDDAVGKVWLNVTFVRHVPYTVTVKVPYKIKQEIVKGNQIVIVTKTVFKNESRVHYKPVSASSTRIYKMQNVSFYNNKGKKLNTKKSWDRLNKGEPILLSADDKRVDPRFLRIVRDDALIMVVRQANAEQKK